VPIGDPFRREEGRLGPRQARLASNRDVGSRLHGGAEGRVGSTARPKVRVPDDERKAILGGTLGNLLGYAPVAV